MDITRFPALAGPSLLILSLMVLHPAGALAQSLPDIQDLVVQGEQVNRNAEAATGQVRPSQGGDDGAVDGEAGVYVLTLNRIFQLSASGGVGYTDNPTRTSADTGSSGFADFSLGASIGTRLAETVDIGIGVAVNGREFFEDVGPSTRSVSGTISAGLPVVGPLYLGVAGFGGYSFDGRFERGVSFYGASATLSASLPVTSRLALRPGVGIVRQWSGIEENNSVSASASLDISYALTPRLSLLARGVVSRRWYDDFYEDVTFVDRRDTLYGVSATLAWRPTEALVLSATAGFDHQQSRLFLADFDAFEGALAVTLRYRF